jgi:2'-5' RNA ligase
MKVAFALLVDHKVHNFMRKLAVDIHARYQTGFLGALLPPHISLKQPFQVSDLAGLERYFCKLAQSIESFDITLVGLELQVVSVNDEEYGILWLSVQENQMLRDLHNRINQELSEQFENTSAPFDGPGYRFHATVALGEQPGEVYRRIYDEYKHLSVNLRYTVREIAMFYYDDAGRPGTFITYKVLPVGKMVDGG